MELSDYWRVLRNRWRIFLAVVVLGVTGAFALTSAMPQVYTARTDVFVAPEAGSSTAELMQGSTFILNRVKSYVEVIDKELVLQPVIERLELSTTPRELAMQVAASVRAETVVVSIRVTDSSPEQAATIANTIASEFQRVAPQLEPMRADETSVVRITVVSPAEPPASPSSPSLRINLVLGLLAGLGLGTAAAVLREVTDRRIKRGADLAAVTDAPVIGHIPVDPAADGRPLIVGAQARSPRAEAIRQVRTNLQFLDVTQGARSYVVTSSLPGEGKSATSINLAITLAEAGLRVCLLEADLRRPTGGRYLDLESSLGLTSVLIGTAQLQDVIQSWGPNGLDVVLSGPIPPNPSELLATSAMGQVLAYLESAYDIVIVDSPPLLPVTDAAILAKRCAGAIVIVAVGRQAATRTELRHALDKLHAVNARVLGVVLNKLPRKGPDGTSIGNYQYGEDVPTEATRVRSLLPGKRGSVRGRGSASSQAPTIRPVNWPTQSGLRR